MKSILRALSVAMSVLLTAGAGYAGSRSSFLSHGPSVAAFGRGETGAASFDDMSSGYYNPALLASLEKNNVSVSHYALIAGSQYNFLGVGVPFMIQDKKAVLALYAIDQKSGDVELRDTIDADPTTTTTNQWAYLLSGAAHLEEAWDIDAGVSLKYISLDLAGYSGGGMGLDCGVSKSFKGPRINGKGSAITAGLGIQNLVSPTIKLVSEAESYSPLTRLGATWTTSVARGQGPSDSVTALAELLREDDVAHLALGFQYVFVQQYILRAGYSNGHVTAGAGWKTGNITIDYAADFNNIESINRFGFSYSWGSPVSGRSAPQAKVDEYLLKEAQKRLNEADRNKAQLDKETAPLFKAAMKHYRNEQYLKAADMFRDVLVRNPGHQSAETQYAAIENEMQQCARSADADPVKLAYAKAYVAYRARNYDAALAGWRRLVQLDTENTEIYAYIVKVESYNQDRELQQRDSDAAGQVSALFDEGTQCFEGKKWIQCIKKMEKVQAMCKQEPFNASYEWSRKAQDVIHRSVTEAVPTEAGRS